MTKKILRLFLSLSVGLVFLGGGCSIPGEKNVIDANYLQTKKIAPADSPAGTSAPAVESVSSTSSTAP